MAQVVAAELDTGIPADPDPPRMPVGWQLRVLEVVPGLIALAVIISPLVIAIFNTVLQIAIVILLDLYWLIRSVVVVRGIRRTHRQLRVESKTDWWARCEVLSPADYTDPDGVAYPPNAIYHAALIPTYTEKYEVLEATVSAWLAARYPDELKIVAIITRHNDEHGIANVTRLKEEFGERLHAFIHIVDPLLPGIVVGKSAAMAYGGPELDRHLAEMGLDARRVIVTDLDSDFRVHPEYLARITWEYCQDRGRDFRLYQPVPMFHNNIWRVPAAVHVMASSATQWQMFLHTRPQRIVVFASYSMSMHLVRDVGYWDPHVIQEDSRFYWRTFFRYGTRLKVRGIPLPIYGDCPRASTYGGTHMSQYNQIKRWAWGVSDVPFVVLNMITHREIPLHVRLYKLSLLIFNHLFWVAMPILLLFGASIPGLLILFGNLTGISLPGPYDYSLSSIAEPVAIATSSILTLTLLNVAVLIFVDESLVPPRPSEWPIWKRVKSYTEIFLYPVIGLLFSVLPALESQLRLMFGFYLEYRVTEKE